MKEHKEILLFIKSLQNHNLISTKDILEDDSYVYMIMNLCEGGTLLDRVNTYGAFTEKQAATTIEHIVKSP